jgi:hypothetical protein
MKMTSALTATALAVATIALGAVVTPHAVADGGCGPGGGPPPKDKATGKDVSAVFGQPATLWVSDSIVGLSTPRGYSQAPIQSASPLQRTALMIDAQQDGHHQLIVSTGREAILYTVIGCTIAPAVDSTGLSFRFDLGHRRDVGDGIGCSDLGDGQRLVQLLQMRDDQGKPLLTVRRTEIDLNGPLATTGRSDVVTATSENDPAWTSAADISCGDLTMSADGVAAPY